MSDKRILIVDDEAAVLSILKNSLKKLGPYYEVVAVTDGFTALAKLKKQPFDLIVTDYKMAGMDGLELLEAIRFVQPGTRVIMITAYGNDSVEAEARRLEAYRYLTKPFELDSFRQVVQEALGDLAISKPGILIMSDERYRQAVHLLEQMQRNVGARCIFLTDISGRTIARTGNTEKIPIEEIATLMGGGMATLSEAGHAMDGDIDTINLAYREGKKESLYAINIGQQLLLILVIACGQYSSRLGTVWYYARQTAEALLQTVGEGGGASPPPQIFNEELGQAFDAEMDKLFKED